MFFFYRIYFSIMILSLLAGCCRVKNHENLTHPLYKIIPSHRCQIQWYDLGHWTTWALFGNDDDGIFGEKSTMKPRSFASFWIRNPFHNFCFYVIGSANYRNSSLVLLSLQPQKLKAFCYHPCKGHVFASKKGSSFQLALHGGKPFVSLRLCYSECRKAEFYLGWREKGNFGIKLQPFQKKDRLAKKGDSNEPEI